MKKIDLITGVFLIIAMIFYAFKANWESACICGVAILTIINSYRINRLEKRK